MKNNKGIISLYGIIMFWALFIGIGAVAGAVMMWVDPTGKMWGMDPLLEMLREKMPWPDIFFRSFIPSGFVLLAVNGITQFVTFWLLKKHHRLAPYATLACGLILISWIILEWVIFGFNALSNLYFAFGVIETILALLLARSNVIDGSRLD